MNPERQARSTLTRLCEPGSWAVHDAVEAEGAEEVVARLSAGKPVGRIPATAVEGARLRAEQYDPAGDAAALTRCGARLLCPGDDEWPEHRLTWFPNMKEAPPLALHVRGPAHLADVVERSVGIVGARAASAYGVHVAGELALGLADRGWTVLSGAAYGVDGAAHSGALCSAEGAGTVAVLASGVDVPYPKGHDRLITRIAEHGLLVSEVPPGSPPTRLRFLVRNRLIAALSLGTVVVEAAVRSGSLTTARQARELNRVVMAVPGPVTSGTAAGSNALLRGDALCVTRAAEVLEAVGAYGADAAENQRAPETARDALSETVRQVLDAVPVRDWAGESTIARAAGLPALTVLQVLPPLEVAGLVERGMSGWRLTGLGAGRPARAPS
ncbi:MAG: DNA-processing protein DprA [Actinobacteria bacterium]|nr:DNA-processing protein DprA [Actinomycetota bacterium]MCA1720866.1 DNA-processing protein DprA [Actinomycetota bacterium]